MQVDTLGVDEHGTVLADRPLLDCAHVTQNQPPTRNGSPLPVELAKTLIRCLFEKPSEVGSDGVTGHRGHARLSRARGVDLEDLLPELQRGPRRQGAGIHVLRERGHMALRAIATDQGTDQDTNSSEVTSPGKKFSYSRRTCRTSRGRAR